MRTIGLDELKLIQLDVVQALHDFCIENNIKYSLACGSLLGAIRHNGYIPWDDDIDVYMEREDYNKFVSVFPKSNNPIYKLACLETDERWHIPYGKLYDDRTLIIEDAPDWLPIGVNIDVFPVDAVPEDSDIWLKYNKRRSFLRDFIYYKYSKTRKEYSVLKNCSILFVRAILCFVGRRFHAKMVNWYAQRFRNDDSANCLFENVQGIFQKRPFDKKDFSETILHKFEDRELCVMSGYDHCLRCGFGDYMKLPPVEKRVSHHSFKAYWK